MALKIPQPSTKPPADTDIQLHKQFTLDISRYLLSKELRKDAPKLARKGELWGVFVSS